MIIEKYRHHGIEVSVCKELKGKHRNFCLCWLGCKRFTPENRDTNCKIANRLYENCVDLSVTTPVFECANYKGEHDDDGS